MPPNYSFTACIIAQITQIAQIRAVNLLGPIDGVPLRVKGAHVHGFVAPFDPHQLRGVHAGALEGRPREERRDDILGRHAREVAEVEEGAPRRGQRLGRIHGPLEDGRGVLDPDPAAGRVAKAGAGGAARHALADASATTRRADGPKAPRSPGRRGATAQATSRQRQ